MNECMEPTNAQMLRDTALLENIRDKVVIPFIEDVENAHPEFEQMNVRERANYLSDISTEYAGKGNCLFAYVMVMHGTWYQYEVYSGEPIREIRIIPGYTKAEYINYIRDNRQYRRLNFPFRAALITRVVSDTVLIDERAAFIFVLTGDIPAPKRVLIEQSVNYQGEIDGYTISIRDAMPSAELMLAIGKSIRESTSRFVIDMTEMEYDDDPDVDLDVMKKINLRQMDKARLVDTRSAPLVHRRGQSNTETMVAYIDSLEMRGMKPGRGGTISWERAKTMLENDFPDLPHYTDYKSLADSYHRAKKRRPQIKPMPTRDGADAPYDRHEGR